MQLITDIFTPLLSALASFSWRDAIEIIAFSAIIYRFLRWLNEDQHKQLVLYFYGYCGATICAHYLHLTILSQTLLILAPVVLCIFVIVHQHSLQKNFVALKKVQPAQAAEHWIDELIRASLYAMNKSKNVVWVIERKDNLDATMQAPCLFYADLKKDLVDLLLDTQTTQETMLWVQQTGKLVASNVAWNIREDQSWLSPEAAQLPLWQQQALLVSSKTDAIIVYCCALTRLLSVVTQEKSIDNLSAHQTALLLKRMVGQTAVTTSSTIEGISYASQSPHTSSEQRHT